LVNLLNHLVAWIAEQESFLFDELFLSLKTTILIYCSLFAILIWAYKHSVLKAFSSVIITTCLCFNLVKEYQNARAEHSFWILHKYMASAIVNQQGHIFNILAQILKVQPIYSQTFRTQEFTNQQLNYFWIKHIFKNT